MERLLSRPWPLLVQPQKASPLSLSLSLSLGHRSLLGTEGLHRGSAERDERAQTAPTRRTAPWTTTRTTTSRTRRGSSAPATAPSPPPASSPRVRSPQPCTRAVAWAAPSCCCCSACCCCWAGRPIAGGAPRSVYVRVLMRGACSRHQPGHRDLRLHLLQCGPSCQHLPCPADWARWHELLPCSRLALPC